MVDPPIHVTDDHAAILVRMVTGQTLTHSRVGERLWSLREDPFTVFDDVTPRRMVVVGHIERVRHGSLPDNRPDEYGVTPSGHAALAAYHMRNATG